MDATLGMGAGRAGADGLDEMTSEVPSAPDFHWSKALGKGWQCFGGQGKAVESGTRLCGIRA